MIRLFAPTALLIGLMNDKWSGSLEKNSFSLKLFSFIFDENRTHGIHLYDESISWKQDRIMRICCIIRQLHKRTIHEDIKLYEYLSRHEKSSFRKVTLQDIRDNGHPDYYDESHFIRRLVVLYTG